MNRFAPSYSWVAMTTTTLFRRALQAGRYMIWIHTMRMLRMIKEMYLS